MIETGTIIESIFYLLRQLGSTDKLKLVKLIYFADKFHLIKYGRTITNDEYWAMDHGPVGSTVKDILAFEIDFSISKNERDYAKKFFSKDQGNAFKANQLEEMPKLNFLSETDIEALDYIIQIFGQMSTWDIRNFSHNYPEWSQYEELFKNKAKRREKIYKEELFSTIPKDVFPFTPEDIENSKDMFIKAC